MQGRARKRRAPTSCEQWKTAAGPMTRAGLSAAPVHLPPVPAHAVRLSPTASGVSEPWPGRAMPQAKTVLISTNVISTCGRGIVRCSMGFWWFAAAGGKRTRIETAARMSRPAGRTKQQA